MLNSAEYRYCLDCGAEQPFEQVHPLGCPDAPGDCPEWSCTGCGATLMLAVVAA